MKILVLKFSAPIMAFGAPIIDEHGKTANFPPKSMITGLIGNALGYHHSDSEKLQRLQGRLKIASRQEKRGEKIIDYQTADLGKKYMQDKGGWTTYGSVDTRKGASKKGTHIRYRHYIADGMVTVFVGLEPEDESPGVGELKEAIINPVRPLFIGRKCCIPSGRVFDGIIEEETPLKALKTYPSQIKTDGWFYAQWEGKKSEVNSLTATITDERDWDNQVHCGERIIYKGRVKYESNR